MFRQLFYSFVNYYTSLPWRPSKNDFINFLWSLKVASGIQLANGTAAVGVSTNSNMVNENFIFRQLVSKTQYFFSELSRYHRDILISENVVFRVLFYAEKEIIFYYFVKSTTEWEISNATELNSRILKSIHLNGNYYLSPVLFFIWHDLRPIAIFRL